MAMGNRPMAYQHAPARPLPPLKVTGRGLLAARRGRTCPSVLQQRNKQRASLLAGCASTGLPERATGRCRSVVPGGVQLRPGAALLTAARLRHRHGRGGGRPGRPRRRSSALARQRRACRAPGPARRRARSPPRPRPPPRGPRPARRARSSAGCRPAPLPARSRVAGTGSGAAGLSAAWHTRGGGEHPARQAGPLDAVRTSACTQERRAASQALHCMHLQQQGWPCL